MSRFKRPSSNVGPSLFEAASSLAAAGSELTPLAERMRPRSLEDVIGQHQVIAPGRPFRKAIEADRLTSSILWGPPGSGKTTLARVIQHHSSAHFVSYSAVTGSLPELREILHEAKEARLYRQRRTILWMDEIHRFNKSQQDAFLPYVEDGTITLIGATTENPSFSINAALLSRCQVIRLQGLGPGDMEEVLRRAIARLRTTEGFPTFTNEAIALLAKMADGDARRGLGLLENVARDALAGQQITPEHLVQWNEQAVLRHDRSGDQHYDVVSALIKSMRGSDPDASIYWAMRMLEAGEDPMFLLRRLIIFASEDVGNADPRALQVVVDADHAFRRLGMPEGMYPIAQAVLYLAVAPKSNAVTVAWKAAQKWVQEHGTLAVPVHLRNAPTKLMREQGMGAGYRYPHDEPGHHAHGVVYLPEELEGQRCYHPTAEGLEKAIGDRLARLRGFSGGASTER